MSGATHIHSLVKIYRKLFEIFAGSARELVRFVQLVFLCEVSAMLSHHCRVVHQVEDGGDTQEDALKQHGHANDREGD